MSDNAVLVTGAAGYIGSHCVKRLLAEGWNVVGLDNMYRGTRGALEAIGTLPGAREGRFTFVEADIADHDVVMQTIRAHGITATVHFAALAYVGESVGAPLDYYINNTSGTIAYINACVEAGVQQFVFSSTCATFGEPPAELIPIAEACPQHPINPYGASKLFIERVLMDTVAAQTHAGKEFGATMLRYFNVAGCDPDGVLGEDHTPETHLIPIVIEAALGKREAVTIFGTDYATPDGTCIRDYIHVDDLVDAHVRALEKLEPGSANTYNLGNGTGISVREIVDAVQRVSGREFEVRYGERRPGDPPTLYADATKARSELGWSPRFGEVDAIIETAWRWFSAHPDGY